jgi:glycosyltransferase involved in cell wall biosynthesis
MSVVQSSLRLLGLIGRSFEGAAGIESLLRVGSGAGTTAIALPAPRPAPMPIRPTKPAPGVHDRPSPKRPPATEVPPGSGQDRRRKDTEQNCPTPKPQLKTRSDASASPNIDTSRATGKHVVILVENLPVPFDRRPWQIAQALTRDGYRVSVICPKMYEYTERYERLNGIDVYRYPALCEGNTALGWVCEYVNALFWMTWICLKLFLTRGIDAIHACNPPDLLFLVGGFFKLLGKKFLFDHHDINPELYEAKFGRRDFFYRLLVRLERWSFRTADVSIATNESYRRIAIERGDMRPDRVFVVRSGPCLERLRIVPPDERLKRGRRYLVGYVGVMGKQEGIDWLLRAVRLIVSRYGRTDVQFGLVGGGTSLEEMKALARRLEIDEYVTFTGRVPDAEMLTMLNTAEVCVNPDIPTEMNDKSTMNKIMEYMALGKPIVQFDLTEGRYSAGAAASNARRGDIADFAERILALLDDPALRARMGAAGRERVERTLSWDHEVPRLLAAYESLWRAGEEPSALSREVRGAMDSLAAQPASEPAVAP